MTTPFVLAVFEYNRFVTKPVMPVPQQTVAVLVTEVNFRTGRRLDIEELCAAAHAGCFAMKLSFVLNGAGFTATKLDAKCVITLGDGEITSSEITLNAEVPGISDEQFAECVKDAELKCLFKAVTKAILVEISFIFQ